jgi:hypothetical protein
MPGRGGYELPNSGGSGRGDDPRSQVALRDGQILKIIRETRFFEGGFYQGKIAEGPPAPKLYLSRMVYGQEKLIVQSLPNRRSVQRKSLPANGD